MPCRDCERVFWGQTGRDIKTRIKEHKNSVKYAQENRAKVFDRVPRNKLCRILADPQYGIPSPLIQAVKSLYQTTESAVLPKSSMEDWFEVACGVRGGLHGLTEAMNRWMEQLTLMGMELNAEKCEIMVISREESNNEIWINEKKVKEVSNFKYLGADFNSKGRMEVEINTRIVKYNKEFYSLYPLLKDTAVPTRVKKTIYVTILRPILTYGYEAWKLT
ncbi:uncharacterized protein LOC143037822 [Oratosquilla oratoria]|uniref:uncharacterized protein LOC143037822 n=1 Tax=Oratosquilla oratoria TaxID=337810 RepID=UPI003F776C6D